MNPPSSSSSQRLPSLRDISDIQKVVIPFSKSILNKKTYVPNLFLSRNVQPKVKNEENAAAVKKEQPSPKETSRRQRPEKKLLAPVETFVPSADSSRGRLAIKSKSKIISASIGAKRENVDRVAFKDVYTKQLSGKFENLLSVSPHDLPVSLPQHRPVCSDGKKIHSLLTDILKPEDQTSPLFLLRTPKYIPAMLDDSKTPITLIDEEKLGHPKNPITDLKDEEKLGRKCTIHDLPEGQIGKLQILKSGKLRLILGKCKFSLHRGVNINFKEEIAAVKTDPESKNGEIINLGDVKERINVVPDAVTKLKLISDNSP